MNDTSYTLERAAELLSEGWCRGWNARNQNGAPVCWSSTYAVTFCALGAILRCDGSSVDFIKFEKYLGTDIVKFNDKCKDVSEVGWALLDCAAHLREKDNV